VSEAVQRRRLIVAAAGWPLAACAVGEVRTFPTIASALTAVASLAQGHRYTGAWSLAQMLQHAAQSIDCSIDGYPQLKSALFRKAIGSVAFTAFQARGKMSHALAEPIPGAPALDVQLALPAAITLAQAALRRFEAYTGALAPHFAYGELDKAEYTRAHLMHLANHWLEVERS
jgi:Protein of unknown function (DUF1569)